MKAKWVLGAAMLALCGCAAMDKIAGMGIVSQNVSTFDNATVIEVSPNSLYDPGSSWGTSLQLGARWISSEPNLVALVMAYNSDVMAGSAAYIQFSGMEINVDGQISGFSTGQPTSMESGAYNTVSHTIYTSSTSEILIPYSLLQRMVAAKDCRIRIQTGSGYQDAVFSTAYIPGGKATAITSIREFMARVDAVRGQK